MAKTDSTAEIVPLADRLGLLQIVRSLIVLAVVAATALEPSVVGMGVAAVAKPTAVYALVTVVAELSRRVSRRRGVRLVQFMVLLDGVYLAAVMAPIGGSHSVLIFLVYLDLIAVTLLISHRAGLKLAIWQALLMVAGQWAAVTGVAARPFGLKTVRISDPATVAVGAVAFLVVAIGTAAFSSLSERELRRGKAELAALAAMATDLEHVHTADGITAVLVDRLRRTYGFVAGVVVAVDAGQPWPDASADAVVRGCCEERTLRLIRRLDPAADPVLDELLPGARNIVVVPMLAEGRVLGAVAVVLGGGIGTRVTRATLAGVTSFVAHAALAVQNARLLEEVERLARTDALTGLANRRTFEAGLHREVARAQRSGEPLSLLLLDVDYFKRINDTVGHQAGDEVLRFIGSVLADEARETDLPARYGGEEFCVVLPSCPPSQAVAVAERLRVAIAGYAGPVAVTASAGIACLPANAVDATGLLTAADEALYESKRSGRDRTTMSTREVRSIRLLA